MTAESAGGTTSNTPPLFSVVIPTTGNEQRLVPLLDGLERQGLPRERWELILAFDGARPSASLAPRLERLGARVVPIERRSGPPVARNAGAAVARGEFLVCADDDIAPDPQWLAHAAARLETDPALDVIEGATLKPGGRPVRRGGAELAHQYILCNLFVRRTLFEQVGGFHTGYFEPGTGLFFREDADLGWKLEDAGAHVAYAGDVIVTHPEENPHFLDPLRWTRRYVMDALLAARFPRQFGERIEVHRVGSLTVRRPIVRASLMFVAALVLAAVAAAFRRGPLAISLLALAAVCFVPVWAKWRFDPLRLPVILLVPFGLAWALARGWLRARRLGAHPWQPRSTV